MNKREDMVTLLLCDVTSDYIEVSSIHEVSSDVLKYLMICVMVVII